MYHFWVIMGKAIADKTVRDEIKSHTGSWKKLHKFLLDEGHFISRFESGEMLRLFSNDMITLMEELRTKVSSPPSNPSDNFWAFFFLLFMDSQLREFVRGTPKPGLPPTADKFKLSNAEKKWLREFLEQSSPDRKAQLEDNIERYHDEGWTVTGSCPSSHTYSSVYDHKKFLPEGMSQTVNVNVDINRG